MVLRKKLGIGAMVLGLAIGGISEATDTGVGIGIFDEREVEVYRPDLDGLSEAIRDAPKFMEELIVRNPGADFCVDVYEIRREVRDWDFEDKLTEEQELLSSTNEGAVYVIHFNDEKIGQLVRYDKRSVLIYQGRFPSHVDLDIRKFNEKIKYRSSEDHVVLTSGLFGKEGTAKIPFDYYKPRESFTHKESAGIGLDITTEDFLPLDFSK